MADLTPLLAFRWSPRAFDPTAALTAAEAASLLEAARWAPSAGNGQPWRFALGHRDDETCKRILVSLAEADQRWARHAAALLLGAHTGGDPERYAYDLGQAVAHLTVQATALGLYVRQTAAASTRAGLAADLDLPAGIRPLVVAAVGRLGDPSACPGSCCRRETGLRRRHPVRRCCCCTWTRRRRATAEPAADPGGCDSGSQAPDRPSHPPVSSRRVTLSCGRRTFSLVAATRPDRPAPRRGVEPRRPAHPSLLSAPSGIADPAPRRHLPIADATCSGSTPSWLNLGSPTLRPIRSPGSVPAGCRTTATSRTTSSSGSTCPTAPGRPGTSRPRPAGARSTCATATRR